MLTCIARSKQPAAGDSPGRGRPDQSGSAGTPSSKQPTVKSLTSHLKDKALKVSGAYRQCTPFTAAQTRISDTVGQDGDSDRFKWSYKRTGSSRTWGKEMEARLKALSSTGGGDAVANSASGRRVDPVVFVEEREPKEWVAQVEPGVLITFVSLPGGGNDLKRIRFSQEMFNKLQAQKWWEKNYEKVLELYNVQRLSRQAPWPLAPTARSEDKLSSRTLESAEDIPVTPQVTGERKLHHRPTGNISYASSDSQLDHQLVHARPYCESTGLTSTPKLSSISGTKTETSSRSSLSREVENSEEPSMSNASHDGEAEWVEQDEPGVYITIRALPGGKKELRRVRFSREKFGEMHARLWWEENRTRVHQRYLQ